MKQCSENFSFENDVSFVLDGFFYAEGIDVKELLSLFLGLIYSTKSQELKDDFLEAIAYAINVNEVIKLSQKQFDDLINFMKYYLPKDKDTYSVRGEIVNILSGALGQEEIKITQEQLNTVIEAFRGVDLIFDYLDILVFGPDDFAIRVGIKFVTDAIKKNKELVIDQQNFDILLETLPKIIDFHRPLEEMRGWLKLILRKNHKLKLIKESFRNNADILNFCNEIIEIIEKGRKVKVKIVGEELKRKFGEEIEIEAYDFKDLKEMVGEEIGYHNLGRVNIYVKGKGNIEDLSPNQLLDPETVVIIKDKRVSSPLATVVQNPEEPGGIDFHALPIQTESVSSSALGRFPASGVFKGDLDTEWAQIQTVFNAGIRPSVQRLVEFSAAAASSPAESRRKDDVLGLIADLLRRDEGSEAICPFDPVMKNLLAALQA